MDNKYATTNCCLKCHFLMRWFQPDSGRPYKASLNQQERGILENTGQWANNGPVDYSIACYHDVWDDANRPPGSSYNLSEILTTSRDESCFFYPYIPGMFFPAAAELERRVADRREEAKDRMPVETAARAAQRTAWATIILAICTLLTTLTLLRPNCTEVRQSSDVQQRGFANPSSNPAAY